MREGNAGQPNQKLREERLRRGWTQVRVADELYKLCEPGARRRGEINANMVGRWERGEYPPSLFYQERLCVVFGKSGEELELVEPLTSQLLQKPQQTLEVPETYLISEEILLLYATGIQAYWKLYYLGPDEWMEVEKVLPAYISQLTPLAQQPSKYQATAAGLLSQTHQLAAEIALTRENFNASLAHCEQALLCARLASNASLQAASLIREANTLFYRKRPTIQVNQQAMQYVHDASPLMQGRIYSELSTSYAELRQEQDAYRYMGLAHDCTPDRPEEDPSFSYTHSNHYILFFNDMYTYLEFGQPEEAWKAITKASTFVSEAVTPRRMELLKHFVIVALACGDLELSRTQFETLVAAASTFRSDLHFSEVYNTHQLMLVKWPHERQVKTLAQLFQG